MKPLGSVSLIWSPEFAYALGLLATDGNLSKDGRHFNLTSKDEEQLKNFMSCLGIKVKIGYKKSGYTGNLATQIQFGDVLLYRFLTNIGFTPAKTKTIGHLKIPSKYFFDFLRGHFDGDGYFYSYWDPRWKSSFMFYTCFVSASEKHLLWIRKKINTLLRIKGHISKGKTSTIYQLKYAKEESLKLLPNLYHSKKVVCLSRKRKKVDRALKINLKHNLNNARVL